MSQTIDRRRFISASAALAAVASPSSRAAAAIASGQDIRSRFISLRGALAIPAISIPLIKGRIIKLAALRGLLVIANFWATWCPGCREELTALEGLANKRIPKLEVIAIVADREPRAKVIDFVRALGLSRLAIGFAPVKLIIARMRSRKVLSFSARCPLPISSDDRALSKLLSRADLQVR